MCVCMLCICEYYIVCVNVVCVYCVCACIICCVLCVCVVCVCVVCMYVCMCMCVCVCRYQSIDHHVPSGNGSTCCQKRCSILTMVCLSMQLGERDHYVVTKRL